MPDVLVLLEPPSTPTAVRAAIEEAGGRLLQQYGDEVWIADLPAGTDERVLGQRGVLGLFRHAVPDDVELHGDASRLAVEAWNARRGRAFGEAKDHRRGEGRSWGDPDFEREG